MFVEYGWGLLSRGPADMRAVSTDPELETDTNGDADADADTAVCRMASLRTLLLDFNSLDHLPLCMLECTALTHLSLRKNALEEFPYGVASLSALTILCLSNNKLVDLPVRPSQP